MAVGGVDTYYDYDEKQWKSRRLGGGPIRRGPVCPAPDPKSSQPDPDGPRHRTSRPQRPAGQPTA
jgi:hypothetical protein